MSEFDPAAFEAQVHQLLAAYRELKTDHQSLADAYDKARARNHDIRERLNGVIARLRALEAEAEPIHSTSGDDHGE